MLLYIFISTVISLIDREKYYKSKLVKIIVYVKIKSKVLAQNKIAQGNKKWSKNYLGENNDFCLLPQGRL